MLKKKAKECPIKFTLALLGGKWKLEILARLLEGTKRFKQLEREVEGITAKMLTKELKDLEESRILTRTIYPEIPPRVEYALTESGQGLKPLVCEIKKWGTAQMHLIKGQHDEAYHPPL